MIYLLQGIVSQVTKSNPNPDRLQFTCLTSCFLWPFYSLIFLPSAKNGRLFFINDWIFKISFKSL